MGVSLPPDYKPSRSEDFMNPKQQEYFRLKLLDWKERLIRDSSEAVVQLSPTASGSPTTASAPRWKPTSAWRCARGTGPAS